MCDEWHRETAQLTEAERLPFDDPQNYADTMTPEGVRYGHR